VFAQIVRCSPKKSPGGFPGLSEFVLLFLIQQQLPPHRPRLGLKKEIIKVKPVAVELHRLNNALKKGYFFYPCNCPKNLSAALITVRLVALHTGLVYLSPPNIANV
jgi:hypothetical protein